MSVCNDRPGMGKKVSWLNMVVLSIFFAMFRVLLRIETIPRQTQSAGRESLLLKSPTDDGPKELSLDPWVG